MAVFVLPVAAVLSFFSFDILPLWTGSVKIAGIASPIVSVLVVGMAAAWVILNSIYILIGIPFTHRRLLQGEMRQWFVEDVVPPLAAALLVAGAGRWLIVSPMPPLTSLIGLIVVLFGALTAAVFVTPHMRAWLLIQLKTRIGHV